MGLCFSIFQQWSFFTLVLQFLAGLSQEAYLQNQAAAAGRHSAQSVTMGKQMLMASVLHQCSGIRGQVW